MLLKKRFKMLLAPDTGIEGTAETPPAETVETPPVETPPAETPPAETPPAETEPPAESNNIDIADLAKPKVSYFDQLDENNKKIDLSEVNDINSLVSKYNEQKESLRNTIKFPTKDSSEEEIKSFLSKMGVPKDSESYILEKGELTDLEFEKVSKTFKETAYNSALSSKQAETMWNMVKNHFIADRKSTEEIYEGLKTNLSERFDKSLESEFPDKAERESQILGAVNLFRKFSIDNGLSEYFEKTGLNLNPNFIYKISQMQKNMGSSFVNNSLNGNNNTKKSPYGDSFMKSIR